MIGLINIEAYICDSFDTYPGDKMTVMNMIKLMYHGNFNTKYMKKNCV
jgi:hypothetical protein